MKIKAIIGYLIAYPTGTFGYILYHLGVFLDRYTHPIISYPFLIFASLFLAIAEVANGYFIKENTDYVLT